MKMNKITKSILAVGIIAVTLVSCGTERTREDKVAAIINEVDSPFLIMNTVPGNLIDKSGALDGALPFTQEMLLSFFIDEEVTGVDYDVDVQVVVGKGPSFAPNFYGIFKVKNQDAFATLLETEAGAEIKDKDGYKYVIKESDQYVIVWDEEFAIASNIPIDFAAMMGGGGGDQGMKAVSAAIRMIEAAAEGEVNADVKTFLDNKSDIAMHFDGEGFYGYMMEMSMGENEELEANRESIEGINSDLTINFNNGSIDIAVISDLTDKIKEQMSFIGDGPVNSNLMTYGNSANPMVTMAYNTDVASALDYAEEQMSPYDFEDLERELENLGMTMDEAKSALTGEVLFMIDRIEVVEEEIDWGYGDPYIIKQPIPMFAMVLGVGDKSVINKFMADAEMVGEGMVKNGDAYIVMKNDILFSSNDSLWAGKVLAGNAVKVNDKAGVFSSDPIAAFVDFVALSKFDDLEEARPLVDMLNDMRLNGGMEEMKLQFNFMDDSQNALRILTETISNMTNEMEQERDAEYEQLEAELEEAALEATEAIEEATEALEELEEAESN